MHLSSDAWIEAAAALLQRFVDLQIGTFIASRIVTKTVSTIVLCTSHVSLGLFANQLL